MNSNLNKKFVQLLAPKTQTSTATARTANLDTLGADYATIVIPLSSALNTNGVGPALKLSESDDTVATNFATFNANFNLAAHSIAAAHQVVWHVDTRSRKRFLQFSSTPATATNDDVTLGAMAVLGRLGTAQPAASNQVGSTNDVVSVG